MPRFVSFNINGIRARQHQLEAVREVIDPDVIGLQETKVHDEQFPLDNIESLGYHVEYFGQKAHYGVALLSKVAPIFVQKGFPDEDGEAQKRFIHARYEFEGREIDVLNGYFPQGESQDHPTKFPMKRAYYADLMAYIDTLKAEGRSLVIMGDMNIAPEDIDIGIGEVNAKRWLKNRKTSFLPEERAWYSALMSRELTDTYRLHYPESTELYSWFDYRSRGFNDDPKRGLRIDHILCTADLVDTCVDAGISYELRAMEKPSDHAPIWSAFDLSKS
ncbi:exodeoxyribonuclease III [Psychrobacter sp. CCUG 69069]|uniref:exodeoxyribonuclease III n=1 Tax=unclassified Psychrobacter TaxID=196806 RepID=UPI001E2DDB0C|nr:MULTISPECIES: exodeoxyribonuclease III [unclassified Psychrobacter]MCD1279019.1 exodeoxyribonuclease III [Psychrobacter sp. CCUG 69069]